MQRLRLTAIALSLATACGGATSDDGSTVGRQSGGGESTAEADSGSGAASSGGGTQAASDDPDNPQFQLSGSDDAGQAHGERESQIVANETHAAMRLFVVDPETGPLENIVIKMTAPDGTSYYTDPTDSLGYGEVLVPINTRYQLEYLALGRRTQRANVQVPDGPRQDIRLTLRHRRRRPAPVAPTPSQPDPPEPEPEHLVLDGVLFETGSANIDPASFPRLDRVVEYMTHLTSARIRIAGHTDNVGNPRRNQQLSEARAQAVRTYLVEHEIDGGRIEAVGYGDARPVASNDTAEGRAQNRRIEATEI